MTLENKVQRDTQLRLGAHADLLMMRNNNGVAIFYDEKTAKKRFVNYGLGEGTPDLVCVLYVEALELGVWFCLETKRTGESASKQQKQVHKNMRAFGALVYTADSPEEAQRALDDAYRVIDERIAKARAA